MELGALICTPRKAQCSICPVKKLCAAFKENRVDELPNLGKRETATARHFIAFAVESNGRFLVCQRPSGVVNAQLWEFPNVEVTGTKPHAAAVIQKLVGVKPKKIQPLRTVKHSITRYRITLEAVAVSLQKIPAKNGGVWKTPAQMRQLAFPSAHRQILARLSPTNA